MQTRGIFVTGTDTGVGKTYIAAQIARHITAMGMEVGAYKPVCSGSQAREDGDLFWEDIDELYDATGSKFPTEKICPQRFMAPLAPPVAAAAEGRNVDSEQLAGGARWWRDRVRLLLVEGAGGLLSPLADDIDNADLAKRLGLPLIVVARNSLGVINQARLTVEVALSRGLEVAAVLLTDVDSNQDDASRHSNLQEIRRRVSVPNILAIPHFPEGGLRHSHWVATIDWVSCASPLPTNL